MEIVWGALILLVSLPCWGGQTISWMSPSTAERLKLTEPEDSVDQTYYGDIRGEAAWDTVTLWTMPLAGLLLVLDIEAWAYLGLVAGGMYVYFAGRGVFTRYAITGRGGRVGEPSELKTAYTALVIWGVLGLAVIAGAMGTINGS